jgi:hypothetical protein
MMCRFALTSIALLAVFAAGAPQTAHADLILRLQSGVTTVTIADNDVLLDGDPTAGMILYNGPSTIGVFQIGLSTSVISQPILGSSSEALFDLHLDVASSGPGQLSVSLTDTDFSLADTTSPWRLISSIGGLTDGTVRFQESYDAANAEFGASTTNGPLDLTGDPSFSATLASDIALNSPLFSLTELFTVTHGAAGGHTTFDAQSLVLVQPVPEPASCFLWAAGAAGFGYWRLRRQSRGRRVDSGEPT